MTDRNPAPEKVAALAAAENMTEEQAAAEAAEGWALLDRRFLRYHLPTCGVRIFKANRPECDCGLQPALNAAGYDVARIERLTGADIEAAIGGATPLRDPRLSEVDWDAVAVALGGHA